MDPNQPIQPTDQPVGDQPVADQPVVGTDVPAPTPIAEPIAPVIEEIPVPTPTETPAAEEPKPEEPAGGVPPATPAV